MVISNNDFQDRIVSANTDALVEALAKVMSEFNTRIEIQYGDNFKQLNTAVGTMLDWQKAFSSQLEEMLQAQKLSTDTIALASSSYEQMIEHTRAFSEVAESLGDMLRGLELQPRDLASHLSGLSDLVCPASRVLPALCEYVISLTITPRSDL